MKPINTRIYESKHRKFKDDAARDAHRLERALRLFPNVKAGTKKVPTREIAALTEYDHAMRDLLQEMKAGYGPEELKDSLWRVEIEIGRTYQQLARMKIAFLKPEV